MGLFSTLFGRTGPVRPKRTHYFSVIQAEISLSRRKDIVFCDKAGIVFNPSTATFFDNLEDELTDILDIGGNTSSTTLEINDDDFGTRWVALYDRNFENLATRLYQIGERMTDKGFGQQLLAAVFGLEYEGKKAYLVYNIKRGRFYPLVLSDGQQRDNESEFRLSMLMGEQNLHLESSLENWYALGGIPF